MEDSLVWDWGNGMYHILPTLTVLMKCQAPEAPHIYRKDGIYYLLIAEGEYLHW